MRPSRRAVRILVKVIFLVEVGKDFNHHLFVSLAAGADEVLVGEAEFFGEPLPGLGQSIAIRLCFQFSVLGGLLHFLAMLVEPGQEKDVLTEALVAASDDVRNDLFISVAKVWLAIDVVDCGGHVERFAHGPSSLGEGEGGSIKNPAIWDLRVPCRLGRDCAVKYTVEHELQIG